MKENKAIKISSKDNTAVALVPLFGGETVGISGAGTGQKITLSEDIPRGHKLATEKIEAGENIIKYGLPIGHALQRVEAGSRLHTHNAATNLSENAEYVYRPDFSFPPQAEPACFDGYLRADGRAATRNEIWIIPTVGCVNRVAERLAAENADLAAGSVEGIYAFTHPYGCSQTGEDHNNTKKILAALARHPNAGAVLIVGLGCENLTMEQFKRELGDYDPARIKFLVCQDEEDELATGRKLLQECAAYARTFARKPVPASRLVVGLKCGGSDGLSGITANPAVGRFSDLLAAQGGCTILTEVPEMFGAEDILLNRCVNEEIFRKAAAMIKDFKEYFLRHGEVVYENPSPGNKEGGITTLEDKSCGCVQKGGMAPVIGVMDYGESVASAGRTEALHGAGVDCACALHGADDSRAGCTGGVVLLCGPGNDLVSTTALTAAGATLILFTTGRGTPFGAPVPTLKISSNSELATRKANWIDFDAGTVAAGEPLDEAARRLMSLALTTAGGQKAKNEINGYREIAVFKDGVVL